MNPIELAFGQFMNLLRHGAERTTDWLCELCGRVLDLFSTTGCDHDLRHCGCRNTRP